MCNCLTNCDCGTGGIQLLNTIGPKDAPIIVNISFNTDNSLKFIFSDGTVLNSTNVLSFSQNNLSYIYAHDTESELSKTLTITADTLTINGDKLNVMFTGIADTSSSAGDINLNIGISTLTLYAQASDIFFGGIIKLKGDLVRKNDNTLTVKLNFRILAPNSSGPYFEIDFSNDYTVDFTQDLNIVLDQENSTPTFDYLNAELIKNPE